VANTVGESSSRSSTRASSRARSTIRAWAVRATGAARRLDDAAESGVTDTESGRDSAGRAASGVASDPWLDGGIL